MNEYANKQGEGERKVEEEGANDGGWGGEKEEEKDEENRCTGGQGAEKQGPVEKRKSEEERGVFLWKISFD